MAPVFGSSDDSFRARGTGACEPEPHQISELSGVVPTRIRHTGHAGSRANRRERRAMRSAAAALAENSLFGRRNSLLAREKFPVRSSREFAFNRLICFVNPRRKTPWAAGFFKIPC